MKKLFAIIFILASVALHGCANSESVLNAARTAYLKALSVERGLMIAASGSVEAGVISKEKAQKVLEASDAALILQGTAYIVAGGRYDDDLNASIDAASAARLDLYLRINGGGSLAPGKA